MRTIFVILLCLLLSGMVFSQKPIKKTESEIDSLSFSYDVRDMTILVNDTLVDYSVVLILKLVRGEVDILWCEVRCLIMKRLNCLARNIEREF